MKTIRTILGTMQLQDVDIGENRKADKWLYQIIEPVIYSKDMSRVKLIADREIVVQNSANDPGYDWPFEDEETEGYDVTVRYNTGKEFKCKGDAVYPMYSILMYRMTRNNELSNIVKVLYSPGCIFEIVRL